MHQCMPNGQRMCAFIFAPPHVQYVYANAVEPINFRQCIGHNELASIIYRKTFAQTICRPSSQLGPRMLPHGEGEGSESTVGLYNRVNTVAMAVPRPVICRGCSIISGPWGDILADPRTIHGVLLLSSLSLCS